MQYTDYLAGSISVFSISHSTGRHLCLGASSLGWSNSGLKLELASCIDPGGLILAGLIRLQGGDEMKSSVLYIFVGFAFDIALQFVVRPFRVGLTVPMCLTDARFLLAVFVKNDVSLYLQTDTWISSIDGSSNDFRGIYRVNGVDCGENRTFIDDISFSSRRITEKVYNDVDERRSMICRGWEVVSETAPCLLREFGLDAEGKTSVLRIRCKLSSERTNHAPASNH
jgi:hypothetical protein